VNNEDQDKRKQANSNYVCVDYENKNCEWLLLRTNTPNHFKVILVDDTGKYLSCLVNEKRDARSENTSYVSVSD